MPRTGLAREQPSLVSLALIVCFSLAVVFTAGWLAMMILFSNDANTRAADRATDAADVAAVAATSTPRVENALPSYAPPGAPHRRKYRRHQRTAHHDPMRHKRALGQARQRPRVRQLHRSPPHPPSVPPPRRWGPRKRAIGARAIC
jgi:hypothetical protein